MVSSVNNVSNNNANFAQLTPPAQLYKSQPAEKTYTEDAYRLASSGHIGSEIAQLGVGALSGYKYNQTFIGASQSTFNTIKTGSFLEVVGSFKDQGKIVGVDAANAAGIGALLSGGVSVVGNTVGLVSGRQSFRGAAGNIVADSVQGAVSGIGGFAVGGMSALALTLFKVTGTPVAIAGIVGGAIGASLMNKYFKTEGIRSAISGT